MEWWQQGLLFWGIVAFCDRVTDMLGIFSENRAWYDKILSSFVYWVMGLAWPWQRVLLPTINLYILNKRRQID